MNFSDLGIIPTILKALNEKGYTHPTPIQKQSIPLLLENKDLLGCAQTGTGKTAAFTIPIIQHIYLKNKNQKGKRKLQALILTPTRELALQINENIKTYAKYTSIRSIVIFGGVKQHLQTSALRNSPDILVATPGRLLDLMRQGHAYINTIKYFVLDEADQMLDMGFINDIKKIISKLPKERQSLFFSATLPPSIVSLSKQILGNPEKITITPNKTTEKKIEQQLYFVSKSNKTKLLIHILEINKGGSILVFSKTKYGADRIVKNLDNARIKAASIHGNKSQNARQKTLERFKRGNFYVLVATDIAARGIDINELSLVINYDLPNVSETYVHRIGRTGRAQAIGKAYSFCSKDELSYLKGIQKLINKEIPENSEHPYVEDFGKMSKNTNLKGKKSKNNYRRKKQNKRKNSNSNNRK